VTDTPDPIYLDYNATTPILPEVVDAMLPYLRERFGNPSSGHPYGRRAREGVDRAREQVARLLGASPQEIFFTSGGTEANNLAIRGVLGASGSRDGIVTSIIEHPATREPCAALESEGWKVFRAPVDGFGTVCLEQCTGAISGRTALVTLMHANNETGTLQPVRDIARVARDRGAIVHTDAAQSVGKVPVRVDDLGVDLVSVAGHKLYAAKGVGALYVRAGTEVRALILGAGHEGGLRPGTENVASIVGLGCACEIADRGLSEESARVQALRDLLWERLAEAVPGIVLHGHPEERLPNTLNVGFPGVSGGAVLERAPEVAASTGSACHAGAERPSDVLTAMGIGDEEALGAVRLSLGRSTTREKVERAAAALIHAWADTRAELA
jgi:cysteine desulfurase